MQQAHWLISHGHSGSSFADGVSEEVNSILGKVNELEERGRELVENGNTVDLSEQEREEVFNYLKNIDFEGQKQLKRWHTLKNRDKNSWLKVRQPLLKIIASRQCFDKAAKLLKDCGHLSHA